MDVGNPPLESVYSVSSDSSQQLLQQVGAVRWSSGCLGGRRAVGEPANEQAQDKQSRGPKQVPKQNQNQAGCQQSCCEPAFFGQNQPL